MNIEEIKGKADQLKGKAEELQGKAQELLNNPDVQEKSIKPRIFLATQKTNLRISLKTKPMVKVFSVLGNQMTRSDLRWEKSCKQLSYVVKAGEHSDAKLSRFVYNPHSCGTTVIIQAITFQNLAFL